MNLPCSPEAGQDDARQSLAVHVAARGAEVRAKYGPLIGLSELQLILADRNCVRYPCELAFDSGPLEEGELAHPLPLGGSPEDGFLLCVHPHFSSDPFRVAAIALYQLVLVNYGPFASPQDAEAFGAAALGIPQEDYYQSLCAMADELSPAEAGGEPACGCGA